MKVGKKYKLVLGNGSLIGKCTKADVKTNSLEFESISGPWEYFIPYNGRNKYGFKLSADNDLWTEVEE